MPKQCKPQLFLPCLPYGLIPFLFGVGSPNETSALGRSIICIYPCILFNNNIMGYKNLTNG